MGGKIFVFTEWRNPINTLVVKVLGTPVGGQEGGSENTFPEGIFRPKSVNIKTTLKH